MVLNVLRSRKVAKRVLLAILVLIIPAFVLWGVGNLSERPSAIGRIGNKKIYSDDLNESLRGIRAQMIMTYFGDINAANAILQNRAVAARMAWERLVLLEEARKKKIRVPDKVLMSYIASHPLFQRGGVFDRKIYDYISRNNFGMEPRRFEEVLRENIMVRMLRQEILGNLEVSDEEVLARFRENNDEVSLSCLIVDKDLFSKDAQVSEKDIREYYSANRRAFAEPAKARVEYVEIPYKTPSERREAMDTLKKEYSRIKGSGSNFMQTGRALGFVAGNTEWFGMEDVVPGIKYSRGMREAVFQLEEGEISAPVFTSADKGAVYIFRRTGSQPSSVPPLNEVRDKIAAVVKQDKSRSLAVKKTAELLDDITSGEIDLKKAASITGGEITESGAVKASGYLDGIGPAEQTVKDALSKGAGAYLDPFPVKKGAALVFVEKIVPADRSLFEKEKEDIRLDLLAGKQRNVMEKWFRERADKIKLYEKT